MPNTKLAFMRYMVIDSMLRNKFKKHPTKQEILEVCHEKFGVKSISTIEKDLNAMRFEFDAPIAYDKKSKGYCYTDESFQLLSLSLSEEQLMALSFVETFLQDFKNLPIFGEFSGAVDKVLDGLAITRYFREDPKSVNQFIQIDKSPYFKGSDMLSKLIRVIAAKEVVRISYQKFGAETPKEYTVHPFLIKEFDNFWYLSGYVEDEGYKDVRTFGIDRIKGFEQVALPYMPPEEVNFDPSSYFSNCYGVTAGKPQRIVLSYSPFMGNYLKARPLHPSQKVEIDNEEEFRVSLELVVNPELQNLVMSYGANVRVIEPETLRLSIGEQVRKMMETYE